MPRGIRYSDEFKRDAVAQITERGYMMTINAGLVMRSCAFSSR